MTRNLCVLRDYATFRFVAGSINLCVELFQILLRLKIKTFTFLTQESSLYIIIVIYTVN